MSVHMGKKTTRILIFVLLIGMIFSAGLIYWRKNVQVKRKVIDLDLSTLISEDGEFVFPGLIYGSTMEELETAGGFYFPEIPYFSDEWVDGTLPYYPEKVFDYRHNPDAPYEDVEFAAYYLDEPVYIRYKEYIGYMTCSFSHGVMTSIIFYFGIAAPRQDAKMDYGGKGNDVDAVYQDLETDLNALIDPSIVQKREGSYGNDGEHITWLTPKKEDGYRTGLNIVRDRHEDAPDRDMTMLIISKLKTKM